MSTSLPDSVFFLSMVTLASMTRIPVASVSVGRVQVPADLVALDLRNRGGPVRTTMPFWAM